MELQSDGIFLSEQRLGERQSVVRIFSRDYGLISGVARRNPDARRGGRHQPGEHIDLRWRARLEEHLGRITLERHTTQWVVPMELDALPMQGLLSMTALLKAALGERVVEPRLYQATTTLLVCLDQSNWAQIYLEWERRFLEIIGFGLDLESCALGCGASSLTHVSPKSGRAVCAEHAAPHRAQLFPMPDCWRGVDTTSLADTVAGLRITGHFLQREICSEESTLPAFRRNLLEKLTRNP